MPFDEKSREEKEAYASKIMAEMKLKNEKLKERYKEVQRDREKAEERNSSITLGRNLRKDVDKDFSPKAKPEREWDRGKPNMDSADWDSKHHEYYPPKNSRVYSDRRNRKDDNWRSRPNASSSRPTSSFFSKYHSNKNETSHESSTHRNDGNHFNNRPRSHYSSNPTKNANDSHSQPYHNSKGDDYSQKVSTTQMNSDVKRENAPHRTEEGADELMWQSGSMIEAQIKFNRIENWVKSINMNHGYAEPADVKNTKEEYKSHGRGRDLGGHREKSKKFGMSDDITPKKSKDQSYFRRNREYTGQSVEYNVAARKKRIRERVSSVSDSKNLRDVKRKNTTDRPRRKCESDMSDHASSMKESDDTVHRGSKSNNFHQQDNKVDCNFQDPWGSDIPNEKDFCQGDEAWLDWGTDQQSKDLKQNSQPLKNKNEYETKPLQHNSKTKYTRQNEKSNWTESKYQSNKFSRNSEDSSKRSLHRRKSGNDSNFHSTYSQVPVTSSANLVQKDLEGIWEPVDKEDNQEDLEGIWESIDQKDNQDDLEGIWESIDQKDEQDDLEGIWESIDQKDEQDDLEGIWESIDQKDKQEDLEGIRESIDQKDKQEDFDGIQESIDIKGNQEDLDEICDPINKKDNQEEFNEKWGSEGKKKNSKIPSTSENCINEVPVDQSWNTLESSVDKESSCLPQDRQGSFEVQGNQEGINKMAEPVAKQDSDDLKQPRNNDETIRIREDSNDLSFDKIELEEHLNASLESNKHSEFICNAPAEFDEFSKPMVKECDKTNDAKEFSESVLSGSEFQKMDYCNESSDSYSQIVNYDGSSGRTSKSADKEYSVEDNLEPLYSENLNEVVSLNKNSFPHDEICKNEQKEGNEVFSSDSNTNRNEYPSNVFVECTLSTSVIASDLDKVHPKLESEDSLKHLSDIQFENLIPVSDEKVIGNSHVEPDVGVSNSDDGWSTVSDEEDDKNNCPPSTS